MLEAPIVYTAHRMNVPVSYRVIYAACNAMVLDGEKLKRCRGEQMA